MLNIIHIIYLILIAFISFIGIYKYNKISEAGHIIVMLLVSTTLIEVVVVIFEYLNLQKAPLYHAYSVIEIFLITLYFIKTAKLKKERLWIAAAAILWPCVAILNCIYFQPITKVNTNMLLIESFSMIVMALYALYTMLVDDTITDITEHEHFWTWVSLLILGTGTFFFWGYLPTAIKNAKSSNSYANINLMEVVQSVVNIFSYSVIGFTFFMNRQKSIK